MRTQFTLRQLFVCVACFAVAFAMLAMEIQLWRQTPARSNLMVGLVGFIFPFFAAAVVGAGVGHLLGNYRQQVTVGFITAIVVIILWMAVRVILFKTAQ